MNSKFGVRNFRSEHTPRDDVDVTAWDQSEAARTRLAAYTAPGPDPADRHPRHEEFPQRPTHRPDAHGTWGIRPARRLACRRLSLCPSFTSSGGRGSRRPRSRSRPRSWLHTLILLYCIVTYRYLRNMFIINKTNKYNYIPNQVNIRIRICSYPNSKHPFCIVSDNIQIHIRIRVKIW